MSDNARRPNSTARRPGLTILSLLLSILVLTPVLWIVSLSLKTGRETLRPGLFPDDPQFANYIEAWSRYGLGPLFVNSAVITLLSVAVTVVVAMCAAYAFAKIPFRGSEWLFSLMLLGLVVPPSALVVPLLIEMRYLGLYDTRTGLALIYVAFGLPISTLVLRGFFAGLPGELIEAARLDGCSEPQILRRIVAPLAKGAISTVVVLLFLANWNEFILALVILRSPDSFTLTLGINAQLGQYTSDYHLIAAASIIAALPVYAAYLALQRQFERGVTEGALKA